MPPSGRAICSFVASAVETPTLASGGGYEFQVELTYQKIASNKQVFGAIGIQNAAGKGDAVIGVAVTP